MTYHGIYVVHISMIHVKDVKHKQKMHRLLCENVCTVVALHSDGQTSVISHSPLPLISSAGRYGSHTKAVPSLPAHGG